VEYGADPFAQRLRDAAQVICADLGTRIYYAQHGSFDTHGGELPVHNKLWHEVSTAIGDFKDDLKDHGRDRGTLVIVFSEFGRRIKDNGSGTDHGSGGGDFTIDKDGELPFRNPPDYERPVDGNRDNVYEIPTSVAPCILTCRG